MSSPDLMWETVMRLSRFDGTPQADFQAFLASRHFGQKRAMARITTNVPDNTPHAITTHFLDTGLGAITMAEA